MSFLDAAAAHKATKEGTTHNPTHTHITVNPTTATSAYGQRALDAEIERVENAVEGTRNDQLFKSAASLYELVAGGVLDEATVTARLFRAARGSGLAESEVSATIKSGRAKGNLSPRQAPAPRNEQPPARVTVDAATGEIIEAPAEMTDDERAQVIRDNLPILDWQKLWDDDSEEEWIIEPLLPARRLVALYSAPKVGKSLLLLELAVAMVTGRDVLGVSIDRPRNVLYVDFENDPRADIRERLQAMRVGPTDLDRLKYLSFPTLAGLDSEKGAVDLMAAVKLYECEVVVVDTVSRAIDGEENENDTWLSFYRHTGLRMKQAGVALIRLDHSGKDESKGQRGGSAKSGDVDAVWRMSKVTDDVYKLVCEAARMPIAEKVLTLHREQAPLRHRVDALGRSAAWGAAVDACVAALDALDLPNDAGREISLKALRDSGGKAGTGLMSAALKVRQGRCPDLSPDGKDRSEW